MRCPWSLRAQVVVLFIGILITSVACTQAEDPLEAITHYKATLEADPENISAWINRCAHYTSLGEYDKAVADCTAALALQPNSAAALQNRATANQRWGHLQESLTDWERLLALYEQNDFWSRNFPERIEYARKQVYLIRFQLEGTN